MAKNKTKPVPFGNTAEEAGPGLWRFKTGQITWQFTDRGGFNFGPVDPDNAADWRPALCVKNLTEAGMFAEGYWAGLTAGRRAAETNAPAAGK